MSNISSGHWANTFTPPVLSSVQALAPTPAPDAAVRAKRSAEPPAATTQTTSWTLPPLTTPSAETTSAADRALQTTLGAVALGSAADKKVQVPANTTIFPLYDAYRRAINAPEVKAFFLTQGVALSTVVVKPDSVTGTFSYYSTSSNKTFTPNDASGWWQASTKLRAAARALDSEGKGLPYAGPGDDSFSRNAILRWYGVTPPTGDGDVTRARQELSATDWSAPTPEKKTELQSRVQTARTAIDALDERAHLASVLTPLIAQKPDEEAVSLSDLQVQVSSTSALVGSEGGTVSIEDALQSHGLALPKTVGELRNAVRWLTASLPPPPPHGNYSGLLADNWSPGVLSAADRADLVTLNDNAVPSESSAFHLLGRLDAGGILGLNNPAVLRHLADHFLDRLLHDDTALLLGDTFANNRRFVGASGTPQLSDQERRQWFIAAIKLQIDPDAPGRPGTVAGYDLYQANNSGRPLAQVREDLEAHLKLNPLLDPRAAPLAAHLFLASAAPEFLVRGIPSTLRMGSSEWADLRLGVALAERLGGAGCSRSMSYQEIIALSRLEPRTTEEAAVMDNYGINILLDWGLMQGLYTKPVDGLYTPQHYQQATQAFATQHEQLVHALKVFKAPLPTRQDLAIANLQKEFPGRSVEQLKAMKVHIADADERRNMKPSEPKTRALLETYMTGDLTQNRWMLLAPGEQPPTPPKHSTPYDSNQDLSKAQQAAVDQNVQALNARIANLPDVQAQLPGAIDAYLDNLKQGLSTTTQRMIANLPLADRQALELGSVEPVALREQVDDIPTVEQTSGLVEERRGRKGTLLRCEYKGEISYFEVFPDKMLIVKREELPAKLQLGGTLQDRPKTYVPGAPTITQVQVGDLQPFDFAAYSTSATPVPGVSSPGIILEKLGDTLAAAPPSAESAKADFVPNSFSSARTREIVNRIMQGNFVHHRDSVLKAAEGKLPLEQQREALAENDRILLGLIPFVGAITDLANGNLVDGTRGLLLDTAGAFLGGAGSALKSFSKATKVVAPFGAKAFRVLEKGVQVVSGFLNPLDGAADLVVAAGKGVIAVPKLLGKTPSISLLSTLGAVEEKMRTFLAVGGGVRRLADNASPTTRNGQNHSVPVQAVQLGGNWYAIHPHTGLPMGTPLDGFELTT